MEIVDSERRIIWTGNVLARQGTSRILADRLEVFYGIGDSPSDWGELDRIYATDNVYYVSLKHRARSNEATYLAATSSLTMVGEVTVAECDHVISADQFSVNLETGRANFNAAVRDERRVRAVFSASPREC